MRILVYFWETLTWRSNKKWLGSCCTCFNQVGKAFNVFNFNFSSFLKVTQDRDWWFGLLHLEIASTLVVKLWLLQIWLGAGVQIWEDEELLPQCGWVACKRAACSVILGCFCHIQWLGGSHLVRTPTRRIDLWPLGDTYTRLIIPQISGGCSN